MRFRFFTIPAFDRDAAQDALNAFCVQHRIVASDRHFVDRGVDSFWAVCVTWVEGAAPAFPAQGKRERVDYRVLRGGSRNNNGRNCRAANRNRNEPGNRNNTIGFRLAPAQKQETPPLTRRSSSLRRPHGPWQKPKATRRVSRPCSSTTESPPGRRYREAA